MWPTCNRRARTTNLGLEKTALGRGDSAVQATRASHASVGHLSPARRLKGQLSLQGPCFHAKHLGASDDVLNRSEPRWSPKIGGRRAGATFCLEGILTRIRIAVGASILQAGASDKINRAVP